MSASSFSATEAKNEFGRVLELVSEGKMAIITRHDAPKAIVLSVAEFNALVDNRRAQLKAWSSQFDDMLARMQQPGAQAALQSAFDATPEQLGKAAVRAARRA